VQHVLALIGNFGVDRFDARFLACALGNAQLCFQLAIKAPFDALRPSEATAASLRPRSMPTLAVAVLALAVP
jgi:hypothetical protein